MYKNYLVETQKPIGGEFINVIPLLLPDLKFSGKIKWDLDRKRLCRDKTSASLEIYSGLFTKSLRNSLNYVYEREEGISI